MTEILPNKRSDTRDIFSVSEINHQLKQIISATFPLLWVEGEISNLARPASGHIYFSLKDANAQIRCVMFRGSQQKVPFEIENGLQVVVRAKVGVYEPRGDLQLIADEMEEAGFGALQRQFEALKKKLHTEGLFAEERKKDIPTFPIEIAIITSPSGAAIKDFLKVVQRRYPLAKKSLYSVPVQGDQAASIINSAVKAVNSHKKADVIVLIRGGGSIEDLWAFNDEQLARTIAESKIPVVTGIGHEIDYTIADFVADLRAPTPSIAAELITPDASVLQSHLASKKHELAKICKEHLNTEIQKLDWLFQRLQRIHPAATIELQKNELRRLSQQLSTTSYSHIKQHKDQLRYLTARLRSNTPSKRISRAQLDYQFTYNHLQTAMSQHLARKRHQFQLLTTTMHAISPLNTLERGYSITVKLGATGKIISKYDQAHAGDQIVTYLATGQVVSRVESTSSENFLTDSRSLPTKPS